VLVAVDVLQSLDSLTHITIASAARRLPDRVGILATARTSEPDYPRTSWLHLADDTRATTLCLEPLSLGKVHAVLDAHFGRSFARQAATWIHRVPTS